MQREFTFCDDDLVTRLPRQRVRDRHCPGARSARQGNLFRLPADQLRERRANTIGHFEKRGVVFMVRIFYCFERRLHRANRNLRHWRLACQIQVGCVVNLEPLLPPVCLQGGCRRSHGPLLGRSNRELDFANAWLGTTSKLGSGLC